MASRKCIRWSWPIWHLVSGRMQCVAERWLICLFSDCRRGQGAGGPRAGSSARRRVAARAGSARIVHAGQSRMKTRERHLKKRAQLMVPLLVCVLLVLARGAQYNYITTLGEWSVFFFFLFCGHACRSLAAFADASQGAVRSTTQLAGAAEVSGLL
jgi:hypothetical protein